MEMEKRTIEFASTAKLTVDLYSLHEIKIKISVNLISTAVFKLTSTAFNNKSYQVVVPINAPDTIVQVMFTHPGEDQEIRLVPVSDCRLANESVLKINVIGQRKDFYDFATPYVAKNEITDPCNLSDLTIGKVRSKKVLSNFGIEKIAKDRSLPLAVNELQQTKNKFVYELLSGLSLYNSALYILYFNKNKARDYDLNIEFETAEKKWNHDRIQREKEFAIFEEHLRRKASKLHLSTDSVIELTAGTSSETKDFKHYTELQLNFGNKNFCKEHPETIVKEYKNASESSNPIRTITLKGKNENSFPVYQNSQFKENSTDEIKYGSKNKLLEFGKKFLKEFKNKYKPYSIYSIETSTCGYPDVTEELNEKPLKKLTAKFHVFPSDEYAFLLKNSASEKISIKQNVVSKNDKTFYLKEFGFLDPEISQEKKNLPSEKMNNYSLYPDLNGKEDSSGELQNTLSSKNFKNTDEFYAELINNLENGGKTSIARLALFRNGQLLKALEKYDAETYITSLRQKLRTAFLSLPSLAYSEDYKIELELDVLDGIFLAKWGTKEYLDNTIFQWKRICSNLDVFKYCTKYDFAAFWGLGANLFRGRVAISGCGRMNYADDYEETILDQNHRYYKQKSSGKLNVSLYSVLHNDNAISSGRIKNYGIEAEIERSFQIDEHSNGELGYNIRFPGIKTEIEHKIPVFKTYVYDKTFVRDYIGGEQVEKNILPGLSFDPWLKIQSKYESNYGKLTKLLNIAKEALANLYYFQSQIITARTWDGKGRIRLDKLENWRNSLIKFGLKPDGSVDLTVEEEDKTEDDKKFKTSFNNRQWTSLLDGIDQRPITEFYDSKRIKGNYSLIKENKGGLLLEDFETTNVGQKVFYSILLVMSITSFLEDKAKALASILWHLETEYKNVLEMAKDEKLKESAELYDEAGKDTEKLFNKVYIELGIGAANSAFEATEEIDLKNIVAKIGARIKADFQDLEEFCNCIPAVKEILEDAVHARSYWLSGSGMGAALKLKTIMGK